MTAFEETVTLKLETYLGIQADIAVMVENEEFNTGKIARLEADIVCLERALEIIETQGVV